MNPSTFNFSILSIFLRWLSMRLWKRLLLASGMMLGIFFAASALAQSAPNISYLVVGTPNNYDYVQVSGTSVNASGHVVLTFSGHHGETGSLEWDPTTQTIVTFTLALSSGASATYVDGLSYGYPGCLIQTAGVVGQVQLMSFSNSLGYSQSGNVLTPVENDPEYFSIDIRSFVYNGITYQLQGASYDFDGNAVCTYTDGTNTLLVKSKDNAFLQIGLPNNTPPTTANYSVDQTGANYALQASPASQNLLSALNGFTMATSGNTATLPAPSIQSFVWNGTTFTPSSVEWGEGGLQWNYLGSVSGSVANAGFHPDGSLQALFSSDASGNQAYVMAGPSLGTYTYEGGQGIFTSFNGMPYVMINGNLLVPQGPVANFNYGSDAYQFTSSSQANNGDWVSHYQTANGGTATVEYSTTGTMVKWTIHPTSGGTATYVDGATVGRPGAYVLASNSTSGNLLNQLNGNAYTASGDMVLAAGAAMDSNGVFDVQGNFMSLGVWSDDPTHVGFSLSYEDEKPVIGPATIELTASRPASNWLWDAATSDGTGVNRMMQLDQNSRLLLYPPGSSAPGSPAVPAPTVVLDPNPGGVSRFDGSVRIAPQGDLSMGEFTSEPAQ